MRGQDKPASRTQHVERFGVVCADLGVGIFDRLDDLAAILTTKFHAEYFIALRAWGQPERGQGKG